MESGPVSATFKLCGHEQATNFLWKHIFIINQLDKFFTTLWPSNDMWCSVGNIKRSARAPHFFGTVHPLGHLVELRELLSETYKR